MTKDDYEKNLDSLREEPTKIISGMAESVVETLKSILDNTSHDKECQVYGLIKGPCDCWRKLVYENMVKFSNLIE